MDRYGRRYVAVGSLLVTIVLAAFVILQGTKPTSETLKSDTGIRVDFLKQYEKEREMCLSYQREKYKSLIRPLIEGKNAILVDMVSHWNLGDNFIQFGEHIFLKELGLYPKQFCSLESCDWSKIDQSIAQNPENSVLLVHGGGNFGDIWTQFRKHHRWLVKAYNNVPIVFLPQSVHYVDINKRRKDYHLFKRHPDLKLFARDDHSLHTFRQHFKANPSELCPDGAFCITDEKCEKDKKPKYDILILAREDVEKSAVLGDLDEAIEKVLKQGTNKSTDGRTDGRTVNSTDATRDEIMDESTDKSTDKISFIRIDWPCVDINTTTLPENPLDHPKFRFELGKNCLCQGKVIVTDRLHGVILSMLLGLPHVFLDNSYKKILSYRNATLGPVDSCRDKYFGAMEGFDWISALNKAKILVKGSYEDAVLWKNE